MLTTRGIHLGVTVWCVGAAIVCAFVLIKSLLARDPWPLVAAGAFGVASGTLLVVSMSRAYRSGSFVCSGGIWRAHRIATWAGLLALWSFLIWVAVR